MTEPTKPTPAPSKAPIQAKAPRVSRKGAPPAAAEIKLPATAPAAKKAGGAKRGAALSARAAKPAKPAKAVSVKPAAAKPVIAKPVVTEPVVAKPEREKAAPAKVAKVPKLPSERVKPLNFRVTPEFRKAFKQAALTEDCKKVELLERIFAAWTEAKKSK
jgi:hypothetical protein